VDAFSLDGQRQLVLVRRDNVEHLIMIGGPNDVLVESQINRALAAGRENNNAAPATPSAAPRRAEPAAVAPAVPVAQAAAKVLPPQPAPAEVRQVRPQTVSPAPAAASAEAAPSSTSPTPSPLPPIPAAASIEPSAKVLEPQRPVSVGRPQPKPVPPRPAMPPPITPAAAAGIRGNVARLTEKPPQASSAVAPVAAPQATAPSVPTGAPVSTTQPAPAPPWQPAKIAAGPATRGPIRAEPAAPTVKPESRVAPPAIVKVPAPPAEAPTIVEAEPHPAAARVASTGPQPSARDRAEAGSAADRQPAAPPKIEDPFVGLDSLEAEMARLLGREK
jgi:hypothetical protein